MKNTTEEKAMNWMFDFNILTEEDQEKVLRVYHVDKWYETAAKEDILIKEAICYTELNALIANDLLKTDVSEYVRQDTQQIWKTREVFTFNGLKQSDDFVEYYFCRGDGESEADNVDADTNTEIHALLLKYRFW
jgi:hypothetical protein